MATNRVDRERRTDESIYYLEDHVAPNIVYYGRTPFLDDDNTPPTNVPNWQIKRVTTDGDIVETTFANVGKYNCRWDLRTSYFDAAPAPGPGSFGPAPAPTLTAPIVQNVTVAAANVEQSHTFPADTKTFLIQARGNGKLKLAYAPGTSGTSYLTLFPGTYHARDDINRASTTIYFQSPVAGLVVEMESWS